MLHALARATAASCLLAWATPAAALECATFAALLDSDVSHEVIQGVVLEAPPVDGWTCLQHRQHDVADLQMAAAFRNLEPARELGWQARFRQCEAGRNVRRSLRAGARRVFSDASSEASPQAETRTPSCRRAIALQQAIAADEGV